MLYNLILLAALAQVAVSGPLKRTIASKPNVGDYSYIGCWAEPGRFTRALEGKMTSYMGMTLQSCMKDCSGYNIFGVEYAHECWCGNEFMYSPVLAASQKDCASPCAGNSSQICGGSLVFEAYSLTTPVKLAIDVTTTTKVTSTISVQRSSTSAIKPSASVTKSSSSIIKSSTSLPKSTTSVPKTSTSLSKPISSKTSTSLKSSSSSKAIPKIPGVQDSAATISVAIPTSQSSIAISSSSKALTSTTKISLSSSTSKTSSPLSSATAAGPRKRGLPYNNATLANAFIKPNSEVSWGYNWYSKAQGLPSVFEYVPMLWSDKSDLTKLWFAAVDEAIAAGTTHVLAFNEPDLNTQSNISPAAAAASYLKYMQPLAGKVKLGAPAVTNGGSPMGLTWLGQFMGNCTSCTIDFVPFHWYDSATNKWYFKSYIKQVHALVPNKPLWITEFNGYGSDAQQASFLQLVMPWLDSLPWMERYAWFYDAAGYLVNSDGSLSTTGQVYLNYTSATVDPFFST